MPFRLRTTKKDKDKEKDAPAAENPTRSPVLQRKATGRSDKRGKRASSSVAAADRHASFSVSAGDIPQAVANNGRRADGSSGTVTPSPEPSDTSLSSPPLGLSASSAAVGVGGARLTSRESQRSIESRKSSAPSFSGSTASGHSRPAPGARPNRSHTMAASTSRMSLGVGQQLPPREVVKREKKSPREEFLDAVLGQEKLLAGLDGQLHLPVIMNSTADGVRRMVTLKRDEHGFGFTLKQQPGNPHPVHIIVAKGQNTAASAVLLANDYLLSVNGVAVDEAKHSDVVDLIMKSGDELRLVLFSNSELALLSDEAHIVSDHDGGEEAVPYGRDSIRKKSAQARTENELALEREWKAVEQVWLVHRAGFTQASLLRKTTTERPQHNFTSAGSEPCFIKLDSGDIVAVDETDVERANPPSFDRCEDLATLRHLNMSSVVHTLRFRYSSMLIHTLAGPHLIVVNPMKQTNLYNDNIVQRVRNDRSLMTLPHLFSIAEKAYQRLRSTHTDQSIIPMGISGSGKSRAMNNVLHYLTSLPKTKGCSLTGNRMTAIQTLLKMFGSCSSVIHDNATRFTSLTGIEFDATGQVVGGSVQVFLLEKSRAARRSSLEYSFHIFYQLFCGADEQLKSDLQLTNIEEDNQFFPSLPKEGTREHRHFTSQWEETQKAFSAIGISADQIKGVWTLLAIIFHLGAANALKVQTQVTGQRGSSGRFANPAAAQRAASLLNTSIDELQRQVFFSTSSSGSISKRPISVVSASSLSLHDSPSPMATTSPGLSLTTATPALPGSSAMEALENFAMGIYDSLFFALLQIINRSIHPSQRCANVIHVMDMPGLQNPVAGAKQEVGLQFEDLCINYAQERLQMLFYDHAFTLEQERYSQEQIECKFMTFVPNPLSVISVCDRMVSNQSMSRIGFDPSSSERKGLFWILDDEAQRPSGTEKTFLEQLETVHGKGEQREKPLMRVFQDTSSFILVHCQGVMPIEYDSKGWLRRAREHSSFKAATTMISDMQSGCISNLIRGRLISAGSQSSSSNSLASMASDHSFKRTLRRPALGGGKRVSLCMQTKFHQDLIMDTLRKTTPQFVLCILPNPHAVPDWQKNSTTGLGTASTATSTTSLHMAGIVGGSRVAHHVGQISNLMDVPLVRSQLRRTEMVNAMRLYRQGYPDYMPYDKFLRNFQPVADIKSAPPATGANADETNVQAVEELLAKLEIDRKVYRLGLSQVFLRAGTLAKLESQRDEKSHSTIVQFQARCRGMLARRRLEKMKTHLVAMQCLQRNIRKFIVFRNWPWWRLYTKVKPLLDVHRADEELREKQVLVDSLQAKIDKMQREYIAVRESESHLKERVSQLSADLHDERATLRSTDETLEQEQMERLRLEQELAELQAEHGLVKNQKEQLSLQLTEAQLLSATADSTSFHSMPDDDDAGDSYYRGMYERAKAEHAQTLQRMRNEMEQENEKLRAAKRKAEQQLSSSQIEVEDLQASLTNAKKKTARVESELDDLQLHLDDEQERNAELERKQRRFDSELSAVQEELEREQKLREKLNRSSELEQTSKLTLSKQLEEEEEARLDLEKQVKRLKEELDDASSLGNKDEMELATFRRQNRELERKLEAQEEELEDFAGQVLQLDKARTRLEMACEKLRQQAQKDNEAKEEELEQQRFASHRKIKNMEVQLEEEYEEKQAAIKAQRAADQQILEMRERLQRGNPEAERRLRKALGRTRALLNDAQAQMQHQQAKPEKVKQMKNQLDDALEDLQAMRRAKARLERDLEDSQETIDSLEQQKLEAEVRLSNSQKERDEVESRLEEEQEELDRMMAKHRHTLEKVTSLQIELEESQILASTLSDDKERLQRQIRELESRITDMQDNDVDRVAIQRAEAKVRELEEKLDLESSSKHRLESTVGRLRDNLQQASSTASSSAAEHSRARKELELKESLTELENREADASAKCRRAERALADMEAERDDALADIKQYKERMRALQTALNAAGSDQEDDDFLDEDSDGGSDVSLDDDSPRHAAGRPYSRGSGSRHSGYTGSGRRSAHYSSDDEPIRSKPSTLRSRYDDEDDSGDEPIRRRTSQAPRTYGGDSDGSLQDLDTTSKPWQRHLIDSDEDDGGESRTSARTRTRHTSSDGELEEKSVRSRYQRSRQFDDDEDDGEDD